MVVSATLRKVTPQIAVTGPSDSLVRQALERNTPARHESPARAWHRLSNCVPMSMRLIDHALKWELLKRRDCGHRHIRPSRHRMVAAGSRNRAFSWPSVCRSTLIARR